MSERQNQTTKATDCRLPTGHRYDADGRCQWCDAERGDDPPLIHVTSHATEQDKGDRHVNISISIFLRVEGNG